MNKCCCFRNRLQTCDFEGKGRAYIKRKRVIECVYPRLSNVSNSFAAFCLTGLFLCLTKWYRKPSPNDRKLRDTILAIIEV